MNAVPIVLGALILTALSYRYYSAFLAAKVMALDNTRKVPSQTMYDGTNYHPTNKYVLFGHHFAAISGAGPLIGPVLAAQFGYAPGLLWMLMGALIAGGVHDFTILVASMRRDGKSLAEIARHEVSPLAGAIASVAVIIIIIVALAGLGLAVVNALAESSWGTFTIAMTIPMALLTGLWMYRIRPGKIAEASAIGVTGVLLAVIIGGAIPGSFLEPYFNLSRNGIVLAIALYGFIASVLPVWMLLCPRDYLSSYLKIGTIILLIAGVFLVHPTLKMPALNPEFLHGGGPIIPGKLFPFLFITIACGAVSGFHALIGSGTTPKMITKESDTRIIGYGAMMVECIVSVIALIAACSLFPADYFAINVAPEKFAAMNMTPVNLAELSKEVGENVAGRPGGAVSLAVGFAQIFSGLPGMKALMSYWYHFAIMFEALFILTTIDTGTRVARFLLQEYLGRVYKPFQKTDWMFGTLLTSGLVVFSWGYFIWSGTISTIWPMFGTANQLLATTALAVAGAAIINAGKVRYIWVTLIPEAFLAVTTLYAGYLNVLHNYLPLIKQPGKFLVGTIDCVLTIVIMFCVVVVILESFRRAYRVLVLKKYTNAGVPISLDQPGATLPEYGQA
ncbi:MAG TPA: carbon starvation protein A [Candidatus Hydrogenedentes bacterium]|nr:carbon starvation protein A [Candidatus Hydrogenedentota bacterium]